MTGELSSSYRSHRSYSTLKMTPPQKREEGAATPQVIGIHESVLSPPEFGFPVIRTFDLNCTHPSSIVKEDSIGLLKNCPRSTAQSVVPQNQRIQRWYEQMHYIILYIYIYHILGNREAITVELRNGTNQFKGGVLVFSTLHSGIARQKGYLKRITGTVAVQLKKLSISSVMLWRLLSYFRSR